MNSLVHKPIGQGIYDLQRQFNTDLRKLVTKFTENLINIHRLRREGVVLLRKMLQDAYVLGIRSVGNYQYRVNQKDSRWLDSIVKRESKIIDQFIDDLIHVRKNSLRNMTHKEWYIDTLRTLYRVGVGIGRLRE